MKASRIALAALASLAFVGGTAFAGTADVRFVNPDRFTDLGTYKSDEQANMNTLSHYIQRLAQQLPPDQVLRVDVLDVDLAGEVRQTRNGAIRVARDAAFPVIQLRWSLESGGRVLRSGDQRLTDLNYRHHLRDVHYSTTSLYYEKHMLDDWFRTEFAPQTQAYAR
jgi:hypothetical protein